jgi:hypothetical protein
VNQQVLDELLALKDRDLDTRSRLLQEGRLYGEYAEEMQQVHRDNAERLDEIATQHGWPAPSRIRNRSTSAGASSVSRRLQNISKRRDARLTPTALVRRTIARRMTASATHGRNA